MKSGGVLGGNASTWANAHEMRFARAYAHAREFIGECYEIVPDELRPGSDPAKPVLLTFLFLRALEFAQSTVVLKRLGLTTPPKATLRSLLEFLFVIAACGKDSANVETFIAQHEWKRVRTLNKVKSSSSENLLSLREVALAEPYSEIRAEAEEFDEMRIEEWARRGGLHDLYLTAYPVLSSAAHPTISDLAKYKRVDLGVPFGIDIRPSDAQTAFLVGSAIQFMYDVARVYADQLSLELPPNFERWRAISDELADGKV